MLDDPEHDNQRFFLTDSTEGIVELAKKLTDDQFSPCVLMESDIEGNGPITMPVMVYPVYFFCRARDLADGDTAAEAKVEALYHARKFLTWLRWKHENDSPTGDFGRIDLENEGINIMTIGPLINGWYAVLIQFERLEPLNMCIDENDYTEL